MKESVVHPERSIEPIETIADAAASAENKKPGEACGVFGIYAPGEQLPQLTYLALQALQHRGQQGAGISLSYDERIEVVTGKGLVREVFAGKHGLSGFGETGIIATGHTRYGTTAPAASKGYDALQPMIYHPGEPFEDSEFTISHNGHMENIEILAREFGMNVDRAASDTMILKDIIGTVVSSGRELSDALSEVLPQIDGAFSLVLSTPNQLIAARDPQGFRPLHFGRYNGTGWAVASEIAALDIIGAEPLREIAPGEILVIDDKDEHGLRSMQFAEPDPALCAFEYVYFSRPDNEMFGETVIEVRERMGQLLAMRDDVDADFVIGVPQSGMAAADGYSQAKGIPHSKSLVRNNYVDRSFIAPTQHEREQAVHNKLNPIKKLIKDKRVVVMDDSIVRGTTTKSLVKMLRGAGASEVHMRISSPPYKWPCYFGMDTGRQDELIASKMSPDEIRQYIDADSLEFLTNEEMQTAVGAAAGKICTACTTGVYPIDIQRGSRSLE